MSRPAPLDPPPTVSVADLRATYARYASLQTFAGQPDSLYAPIRYAMSSAGKHVRPTLLLLANALCNSDPQLALPAAYAVELFHNFTLVHDDIMDAAALRRGKPSVHTRYGVPTAILAGDSMLIHTYSFLLEAYPPALSVELLTAFQHMAIALCEGQQRDMDMERTERSTYAEYLAMIAGKTGILISASLYLGGRIGGLPTAEARKLREAGDLAGRAFQIQDDLLDTFSGTRQTGKREHGDIYRGKQSAPFLKALDAASPAQVDELLRIYRMSPEDRLPHIPTVLSLFATLGVRQTLETEVIALSDGASEVLEGLDADPQVKKLLTDFTRELALRKS